MAKPCGDKDCETRRGVGGLVEVVARHGWLGSISNDDDESPMLFGHKCGSPDCLCASAQPTKVDKSLASPD